MTTADDDILQEILKTAIQTKDGRTVYDPDSLDNPGLGNFMRAKWADAAIQAFRKEVGTDAEDAIADLLCDIRHWCDRNDFDFENELRKANYHYKAETSLYGL